MPLIRDDIRGGMSLAQAAAAPPPPRARASAGGRVLALLQQQALPVPGSPAAAQRVATESNTMAAQHDFEQRRLAAFRYVDAATNSGAIGPGDGHAYLQRHGFIPGGSAYKQPPGWMVPALQGIGDIAQTVHDAPRGAYESSRAVGLDLRDEALREASPLTGRPIPPGGEFHRTRALGGNLAASVVADVQHPLRHPGYTLLDLLGAVGGYAKMAGTAGRAARTLPDIAREVPQFPAEYRTWREERAAGLRPSQKMDMSSAKAAGGRVLGVYGKVGKVAARRAVPLAKTPEGNAFLLRLEQEREQRFQQQGLSGDPTADTPTSSLALAAGGGMDFGGGGMDFGSPLGQLLSARSPGRPAWPGLGVAAR